ncbi:hypothetical protein [Streptomyces sp. NPDC053541]|uniref:hypothetical protein n=1 Tax=Streptomyces sp. NPDC053541 TaxID=3365709 RepID=UPI0037D8088A
MTGRARTLKAAGFLLAGALVVTACGQGNGQGQEQEHKPRVTAREQCDGAISAAAAPALERALGTETFRDTPTGWLDQAAAKLSEDYDKGVTVSLGAERCAVAANGPRHELGVGFDVYQERSLGTYAGDPFMYPYDMGAEAEVGYRRAYLYVTCTSARLKGSDKRPARFMGILRVRWASTPDTAATREDNLIILHSVTLAVVRKLGCVNDAGLPATPVIKPKKPTKVWPPGPVR